MNFEELERQLIEEGLIDPVRDLRDQEIEFYAEQICYCTRCQCHDEESNEVVQQPQEQHQGKE